MTERLTVYQTDKGRYSVRPIDWEGIWDKQGRIRENGLNHTGIFAEKEDAEFFAKAKNAEEKGKLFILPCKPGSKVYLICSRYTKCTKYGERFEESSCCGCEEDCDSHKEFYIHVNQSVSIEWIVRKIKEFGKTVFLTEQEAKEALEGMKK